MSPIVFWTLCWIFAHELQIDCRFPMEGGSFCIKTGCFDSVNLDWMRFSEYNGMYLIMGYPSHMREEAGEMARKSARSMLLFCMLFAFACLLLGGGWRLVGTAQEDDLIPARPYASIRASFSPAQARENERASVVKGESTVQRMHRMPAQDHQALNHLVPSDSNGNVLAAGTYMRAVYQAFALDDGFV